MSLKPKALVIIRVVTAPTSALPERIEDGKDAMIYDSIKTYRIQLDPVGTMPNIDVGVRVDGRDIPDARVNYVAMIFVDRVVHTLEELFGLDKSKVDSIREDLEAGRPVHIEVQALRTQLIQAGFIPD